MLKNVSGRYDFVVTSCEKKLITHCRTVKITPMAITDDTVLAFHFCCEKYGTQNTKIPFFLRKMAFLFSNLVIISTKNGKIIDFYSLREIQKKWNELKKNVLLHEKGEEINCYIEKIERIVTDKTKIIAFLGSDLMYGLFFNEKWQQLDELCGKNQEGDIKTFTLNEFDYHYFFSYEGEQIKEIKKRTSNQLNKMLCQGLII